MAAVTAASVLVIGWLLLDAALPDQPWFVVLILIAFIAAGEALPITLVRAGRSAELTLSTTFAFASLLLLGPAFAVVALTLSAIVVDLLRRRSIGMVVFNGAQMGLALAAAGLVYSLVAGLVAGPPLPLESIDEVLAALPATAAGGVTFFVLNFGLTVPVLVLHGAPLVPLLTGDLARQAWWALVLLAPAPLVVALAVSVPVLLPLLLAPMAALYRSASVLMERDHRALHDALTGLPNRELFADRARQAVAAAERRGETCALLIADLDHFKEVNDTLGHPAGDKLLVEIARRIEGQARETDTVARLGGDEFGVVLVPPTSAGDAERVAQRMGATVAEPVQLEGLPVRVEASVGIALYPAHGEDAVTLTSRADAAMYRAKRTRGGAATYAPSDTSDDGHMWLLAQLRTAIDGDDLAIWYQPQHDVMSGAVVGAEALLRWPSEEAWVPPSRFIPVAEQSGLMRELTAYVLDGALAQARRWRDAGWTGAMGVNVSLRDLEDPAFPAEVSAALVRHGVPPAGLELEITQHSIATEPERVAAALGALHAMGTGLAIDDFGTGSTSLSQLRSLPVDTLKIDRTFFSDPSSSADLAIVASTVALGQMLDLRVVGEGIEHEQSLERLRDLGCDIAQGYFLSRPMSAEAAGAVLTRDGDTNEEIRLP